MIYQIEGYNFNQLSDKAKQRVICWIDYEPMEYQNDNGETIYRYFADSSENEVSEHCEINGYIFNVYGEPIHHLIEKVEA